MPLVFRDRRSPRPTAYRLPPGCTSTTSLQRREAEDGDWVGIWDPNKVDPVTQTPPGTAWVRLPAPLDEWETALWNFTSPAELLRREPGLPAAIPVRDRLDRVWHAPAILDPLGKVALDLPFGYDPLGRYARCPTAQQAQLIAIARDVRAEVESQAQVPVIDGDGRPVLDPQGQPLLKTVARIERLPLDAAIPWAGALLESIYNLSTPVLMAHGLLDEVLVPQVLLFSAGYLPPTPART